MPYLRHARTDPFISSWPWVEMQSSAGSTMDFLSGVMTGTANRAFFIPVLFPCAMTLYAIRFVATSGTGNYDLGFYDVDLTRLASSGSTAMTAAGIKTLTLPEIRVKAGVVYYGALGLSNATATIRRLAPGAVNPARGTGCFQQDSAVPLPATATPATLLEATLPVFAFGVR